MKTGVENEKLPPAHAQDIYLTGHIFETSELIRVNRSEISAAFFGNTSISCNSNTLVLLAQIVKARVVVYETLYNFRSCHRSNYVGHDDIEVYLPLREHSRKHAGNRLIRAIVWNDD